MTTHDKAKIMFVVAFTLAAFGAGFFIKTATPASPHLKEHAAVAKIPSQNLAPSQAFMDDYAEYLALQKEIAKLVADKQLKQKQDELSGMVARLNAAIPRGYDWDETTWSFKPKPEQPLIPPALTPSKK